MARWRKQTADEVYSVDEIDARLLEELPTWHLEDGWIRRKYKTGSWKGALMLVNAVVEPTYCCMEMELKSSMTPVSKARTNELTHCRG